ncbi:uncharacterized protein si:ch211-13c6.2 isoform X1 [Scomber scombrus]|uniref:Uncharacterized protein si:ch211-13c6.2 isoform X1 n=3 Tax=Scomber scombrus TaxID=13677 RepID=A0AAV1MS28_SCOSC
MDNFETPYEDEASTEFIECAACEKSIRGDTLYKIHMTTPGHIKKEDAFVAAGLGVRQHTVPEFEDILQYLEYLKLDEPIIGLNFLDEVPDNVADQNIGPRYTCRLCNVTTNLPEMVHHVIGRKHRQKYMQLKRPDLVTWDKQSIMTQGGKIIRARAEIIERQDGRGSPTPMKKTVTVGKLNISKVLPRPRQNRDRNIPQSVTQPPGLRNYQEEFSHRERRFSPGFQNTAPFHPDDPYTLNTDCTEEELQRADYRESDMYRRENMDSDYRREYEDEYVEEPLTPAALKPSGVHKYDSREEMHHGPEYYPEGAPPFRRPYPEKDQLKEFYTEEVRRGRYRSAEYQPSQPVYPEDDKRQWSLDRESGRHESRNRAGRQGSSESEAKRRSFPALMEDDQTHFIRDYGHKVRGEEQFSNAGPSRTGPFQRPMEVTRSTSDIPEPFRNFLKGTVGDEGHCKRKRKSRFSDATAEELENANEMFHDDYRPPNPKFGGHSRSGGVLFEPEVHRTQHSDLYTESQNPYDTDSYQRGGSDSGRVLDMLNNIEIENAEEAEFLKDKLCTLLKEFKTKKSEKTVQNSHGRAGISSSLKPDMQLPPRHQYERSFRGDSDIRQSEDLYLREDHRRRGREQHQHNPDERHQEYDHPVREEPRHSNRRRYEEVFGMSEMYPSPHAMHPDEPARHPERFQDHMQPRDYRPSAEEFFESRSSAPPLHMERGPRMHRGPQYSNSLDKITSTLLELVARK